MTSQWRFNDVIVRNNRILQIFAENMLIFKFSPKILGKCDFDGVFPGGVLLIMKGNDYFDIHRKFQVHSTSIFGLGAKTKNREVATTQSTPNFDSLPYPYTQGRVVKMFSLK